MKVTKNVIAATLLIAIIALGSGCKTRKASLTPIPGGGIKPPGGGDSVFMEPIGGNTGNSSSSSNFDTEPLFPPPPGDFNTSDLAPGTGTGAGLTGDGTAPYGSDERTSFNDNFYADENFFAANTVYFDFDSSELSSAERPKAQEVGIVLNEKIGHHLLISGHCDERGTEEYNRALGERRALSVREYLISMGVDPSRIETRSFGEDRPADPGHDASAWSKNRRAEFTLLIPKN